MTFYDAFIDELSKLGAEQLTEAPMPELTKRNLFRQGTEFQRGQFAKQMRSSAQVPLPKVPQAPPKLPSQVVDKKKRP
jgi:hypothetical protein